MPSISVFEFLAEHASERGLLWIVELASLLFGTWAAAIIAAPLVIIVGRIPNKIAMGISAFLSCGAFVYLCVDATSWRGETPPGYGYPALIAAAIFLLAITAGLAALA